MKNFALKHPFVVSLLVFLAVFVVITFGGMILGVLVLGDCKPVNANDPCDGHGLAILGLWYLLLPTGLALGMIASFLIFIVLILKAQTKEEQSFK